MAARALLKHSYGVSARALLGRWSGLIAAFCFHWLNLTNSLFTIQMLVQPQGTAGTCWWAQVSKKHLYTAKTLDMPTSIAGGALLWGDDPVSSAISQDLKATAHLSFSCTLCESSSQCKSFCMHHAGMSFHSGGLPDWKHFTINASSTALCFPEKNSTPLSPACYYYQLLNTDGSFFQQFWNCTCTFFATS